MKRLLMFALIVFTVWYGWKHYASLTERRPSHEAIIENRAGAALQRIRLIVDGQTFVKEELAEGAQATFPFRVGHDASFEMVWQWSDRPSDSRWSGGMVAVGPMVQRHVMTIERDAGVLYRVEAK